MKISRGISAWDDATDQEGGGGAYHLIPVYTAPSMHCKEQKEGDVEPERPKKQCRAQMETYEVIAGGMSRMMCRGGDRAMEANTWREGVW